MKNLQATRPDLAEAITEITRQKEELLTKLIGYHPTIQEIKENGEIRLQQQGGSTFYWQGEALVTFSQCEWVTISDLHGTRIKVIIKYKLPDENINERS